MFRTVGAGLVIAGAGLLGERQARSQQLAMATLDALQVSFNVLEAEIGFLATDLEESFRQAAEAAPLAAGLYHGVVNRMHQGERVAQAWEKTVEEWCRRHRLPPRQRSILAGLAAAWGPWRAEDHIRHIHLTQRLMQAEQDSVRSRLENMCRLWRYLGVGGGLIVALLLY